MYIKKYFHIIVYTAVLLMPMTAGAAVINWVTDSYKAATLANIDGYVGNVGGRYGPPYPREDVKYGLPLPVYAQAIALVPGEACSHGTSDITSSIMKVYAKACVETVGLSANSYAEASFTGTFIVENNLFLFDYSFSSSDHGNWLTITDVTDGIVFSNVYFDGLDGTLEVPVNQGHTIEVQFGLSTSAVTDVYEDIHETLMNYSMSVVSMPVRINNGPYYISPQAAYNEAVNNETIQILAVSLTGDLNINQPISVTLESGYNNIFTIADGTTTLVGNMTVSDGELTIADGILEIL